MAQGIGIPGGNNRDVQFPKPDKQPGHQSHKAQGIAFVFFDDTLSEKADIDPNQHPIQMMIKPKFPGR